MIPKTKNELIRACDDAWDAYVAKLKELLLVEGYELGGIERAHEILGQPADDAYDQFEIDKSKAQQAFGAYVDAPKVWAAAGREHLAALELAKNIIVAARFTVEQYEQAQIKALEYGFQPDEREKKALVDARAELSAAEERAHDIRAKAAEDLSEARAEFEEDRGEPAGEIQSRKAPQVAAEIIVCTFPAKPNHLGRYVSGRRGDPERIVVCTKVPGVRIFSQPEGIIEINGVACDNFTTVENYWMASLTDQQVAEMVKTP